MQHAGLEDREPEVPPVDSLAEGVVLDWLLMVEPERIPSLDLDGLLVFKEHRQIWACMRQAWAQRQPDELWADFYLRWFNAAERTHRGLADVVLPVEAARSEWEHRRGREDSDRGGFRGLAVHSHGFEWWLERLRRVAAARRLLEDAQRMAERAWRGDVDGALAAAASATSHSAAPPVWQRDAL